MAHLRLILFICCFFYSAHSWAEYFCSADSKRDGIFYRDASNTEWEIANLRFEKNAYLGSYLSCAQFLDHIPQDYKFSAHIQPLYPYHKKIARFLDGDPLLTLCTQTPGCHLPFTQNFFHLLQWVKSLGNKAILPSLQACKGTSAPNTQNEKPLPISDTLHLDEVWKIPEESLEDKLFETLDREKPLNLYFSSMIFSKAILERLDQWLRLHPQSNAWVFLAYNLHVLEPDFPMDFRPQTKQLHLFPVFQTPTSPDSYHIKGAAFEGKTHTTLLMTVNMRRFREEKVADRIFKLDGIDAFNSYQNVLAQVLDSQCAQVNQMTCSNALRYGFHDPRSEVIRNWIEEGCQHRFHATGTKDGPMVFARGTLSPLEEQLEHWIAQAQHTIFLSSHILTDSRLINSFLEARKKGIEVKVIVGTEINDLAFYQKISAPLALKRVTREEGLTAHAKFILIDDRLAIWGTGNFTKTSLTNPWEIFLATRDNRFISELKTYQNQYYQHGH